MEDKDRIVMKDSIKKTLLLLLMKEECSEGKQKMPQLSLEIIQDLPSILKLLKRLNSSE